VAEDVQFQYVWDVRYVDTPALRDENKDPGTDNDCTEAGDERLYYVSDANFNVTALVDAETGEVVERYMYDPYGKATVCEEDWTPRQGNASAVANDVLYCGYRFDAETGLYHVRYRSYHPTVGRFSQPDPETVGLVRLDVPTLVPGVWMAQNAEIQQQANGINLYQYVVSDPISLVDPYGLWETDVHQTATTRWAQEINGYDADSECITSFLPDQAASIGAADEAVDYGATAPAKNTSWHFRSKGSLAQEQQAMTAAMQDARDNRCADALTHLGNSLHPLQDSFAHTATHGAATPGDHIKTSFQAKVPFSTTPDPDDAGKWPQDVAAAEQATKASLSVFLNLPCNPCVQCEGSN